MIRELCDLIENIANEAINDRHVFRVGVSGGSLAKYLTTGLPKLRTEFTKWQIFFCDERYVADDDPDSTFGVYKANLLPQVKELSESNFFKIDQSLGLSECAQEYETRIKKAFKTEGVPVFDLLLLGIGPDGHTCSLFPDHKLLQETKALIAPIDDSPKPPPCRVTMTLPLINNAKCCVFAMSGEAKAELVKRILIDKEDLPATRVQPAEGNVYLIVDNDAGHYIV